MIDPPVQHPERCPRGIIPRVETSRKHQAFVETVQPPFILVKLNDAAALAERGETATSYFGEPSTVITTTTIRDADLTDLSYRNELNVLTRFEPDIHLPADESIYQRHTPTQRLERVTRSLEGYLHVNKLLEEHADEFDTAPPSTIPLLQGLTPDEYEHCFRVFDELNVPMAGYYAVQYFTGNNPRTEDLLESLEAIDTHAPNELSLFVIGGLGPTLTAQYPDRVDAAAGFAQWFGRVDPLYNTAGSTHLDIGDAKAAYNDLATTTNQNLDVNIPPSTNPDYQDAIPTFTSPN